MSSYRSLSRGQIQGDRWGAGFWFGFADLAQMSRLW